MAYPRFKLSEAIVPGKSTAVLDSKVVNARKLELGKTEEQILRRPATECDWMPYACSRQRGYVPLLPIFGQLPRSPLILMWKTPIPG
jgi:hypothetical protein